MSVASPSFYVTGGTLRHDTPSYIERQADTDLYEGLKRGEFCYVLTSRQMGKSSLMNRTAARLREEGIAVVILDLTMIGQNVTAEQWYGGFLDRMGWHLDLAEELEEFWFDDQRLGPLQRWVAAIRQIVLARVPGRVVFFIDEIDTVRSLPFSTDEFFAAIRECYNRRTQDPDFERLTFCLLGVATPSDLIQDVRTTPFNIGRRIELTDFTQEEAAPLRAGLVLGSAEMSGRSEAEARALLDRVLYWTGGHPYLTQRLCRAAAEDPVVKDAAGVDRHCGALFLSSAAQEKDDNLLFVRDGLLRSEAERASLLDLYGKVRAGKAVPPDDTNPLIDLLHLSGIARVEESHPFAPSRRFRVPATARLAVRNRIYARVFDPAWVIKHMPDAEVRRQKAAYRRGLARAALVGGVVVAVVAGLAVTAVNEARHSRELLARAQLDRGVRRLEGRDELGLLDLLQAHQTAAGLPRLQRAVATVWAGWAAASDHRLIHLMGHADAVNAMAISPDGTLLATGSSDGTARLWSVATGLPHGPPLCHKDRIGAVAFSPDGRLLTTASADATARLWTTATGQPYGAPLRHRGAVRTAAISPDGKLLATGSEDKTARLWEISTGHPHGPPLRHQGAVSELTFSPDGNLLATASLDAHVQLWQTATGHLQCQMQDSAPSQLAFSPDGKLLAAGGAMAQAMLWETGTGRQHAGTLNEPEGRVTGVTFSPDGKLLASLAWHGTVRLWRTADGKPAGPPLQHDGAVFAAAFSPDGKLLATASADSTARLWDTATGKPCGPPLRHQGTVRQVLFTPDGRRLATAALDGSVRLWETHVRPDSGQPHSLPLRRPGELNGIAFSPDGKLLATAEQNTVQLWEPTTGRPHGRPLGRKGANTVAFSPDGRLLAAGYPVGGTALWEVGGPGQPHGRLLEDPSWVYTLAFSPDGKRLATGGGDETVGLWDTTTGRLRDRSERHPDYVMSVAFSPDGRRLASATPADGTVRLWNATTCQALSPLRLRPDPIQAIAFSPDGKWLATGSDNGSARLWDAITGQPGSAPLGHQKPIRSVAFSPDGRLLVTGSRDHTARVWELDTGQPCGPPLRHKANVSGVAFSPAPAAWPSRRDLGAPRPSSRWDLLATASWDGTARLWRLPSPPAIPREMALRTWVELGARLDRQGNAVAIPWQEWRAFRDELQAVEDRHALIWAQDPWWYWSGEAESHAGRGEWTDAIACYARAIRIGAGDWRVWWRRGEAYAAQGQQRQAAADFADAFRRGADWLHLAPSSGDGFVRLQWRAVPHAVGYNVYRGSGVRAFGRSGVQGEQMASPASASTRTPERRNAWTRLTPHPLTGTRFVDRNSGLGNGGVQVYGVAPLFKDGSARCVEALPVTVRAALAVPGFCGSSIEEGDRPGSVRFDRTNGQITLRGSGPAIRGNADGCFFLNRPVAGNFQISVDLLTAPTSDRNFAKAGVMVRESLDPGARRVVLFATSKPDLRFQWRPNADGGTSVNVPLKTDRFKVPITLRLIRQGDTIRGEYSLDGGKSFHPAGDAYRFEKPLPKTLSAGLAVASEDESQTSEAKFDGLGIRR